MFTVEIFILVCHVLVKSGTFDFFILQFFQSILLFQLANCQHLDEIGNIHGHLINGGVVELFNVTKNAHIFTCYKVNGNTLAAKATTTPNPKRSEHSR